MSAARVLAELVERDVGETSGEVQQQRASGGARMYHLVKDLARGRRKSPPLGLDATLAGLAKHMLALEDEADRANAVEWSRRSFGLDIWYRAGDGQVGDVEWDEVRALAERLSDASRVADVVEHVFEGDVVLPIGWLHGLVSVLGLDAPPAANAAALAPAVDATPLQMRAREEHADAPPTTA